ncbi:MAG: GNAT family N-acetyltransferase [Tatlockia sp.]|nr:GNAT family N-acetyltransferase [Tatlockia sp.]
MSNNPTAVIRIATLKDAKSIAKVHIRSWQKMYKEFIPESILKDLSLIERTQKWESLIEKGVKVLVIEMDQSIIGFASVCPLRDAGADILSGEISAIYLHPNHWRKGLGSQLCLAAIAELELLGYKKVCLWVLEDNTQARKFYENLNFEVKDSTKLEEFYEGGALLTQVLYQRKLAVKG